jgi:YHS domain-containing protein
MRKSVFVSLTMVAALCLALGLRAADDKAVKLVCPVSGKEASKDHAVKYKAGSVYFCCDNCPKAFAADKEKFATKANAQLVATKQYRQTKCPLTGKKLNPAAIVEVSGVEVKFCCNNCKGKVAKAEGDEQVTLVFSDDAFQKAFVPAKAKGKKKDKRD